MFWDLLSVIQRFIHMCLKLLKISLVNQLDKGHPPSLFRSHPLHGFHLHFLPYPLLSAKPCPTFSYNCPTFFSKIQTRQLLHFTIHMTCPKIGQFHPNHHGYTRGNVYSPYHISTSSCLTITGADQTQSVCQSRSSNRRNLWSPLNLSNPFINKWGRQTHFVPWSQSILPSWANFWSPYHFLHVINSWGKPKHTWCPETKSN